MIRETDRQPLRSIEQCVGFAQQDVPTAVRHMSAIESGYAPTVASIVPKAAGFAAAVCRPEPCLPFMGNPLTPLPVSREAAPCHLFR